LYSLICDTIVHQKKLPTLQFAASQQSKLLKMPPRCRGSTLYFVDLSCLCVSNSGEGLDGERPGQQPVNMFKHLTLRAGVILEAVMLEAVYNITFSNIQFCRRSTMPRAEGRNRDGVGLAKYSVEEEEVRTDRRWMQGGDGPLLDQVPDICMGDLQSSPAPRCGGGSGTHTTSTASYSADPSATEPSYPCLRLAWFLVQVSSARSSEELRLFLFFPQPQTRSMQLIICRNT